MGCIRLVDLFGGKRSKGKSLNRCQRDTAINFHVSGDRFSSWMKKLSPAQVDEFRRGIRSRAHLYRRSS